MWRRAGVVIVVIVVALAAVTYLRPIPAVAATHLLHSTEVVPGTAPTLPWPSRGTAAVAIGGLGLVASSGNEQAIPAASVTKVMTALIVLEDSKLKKGETGPNITITDADVRGYESDLRDQQSVVKVEVGEQLTLFQVLEGMLIPSANNLAETAARWDSSSIDAFVTKMNKRAADLHLTHTKFADTSGANFVCVRWRSAARLFILVTKASIELESQRAAVSARLFADGINIPSRTWKSVSCSPTSTFTTDCWSRRSDSYAPTSASLMVMFGPVSPFFSLLSSSTMSAVITLVTLAAGVACSLPELATRPSPPMPTAAAPRNGQGRVGAAPGTTSVL